MHGLRCSSVLVGDKPRAILGAVLALAALVAAPPGLEAQPDAEPSTQPTADAHAGADPAPGDEVLLIWRNGQRMRATWAGRTGADIEVVIGGLRTRIPAREIDRVVPQRPAIERYHDMRTVIDDADVDRLLALAEWCRANRLYDQALADLGHVLTLEPANPEALRLARIVEQERALRRAEAATREDGERRERSRPALPRGIRPDLFPLLTEEQVNLLKVWELDLENPPRIQIDRATVDEFLSRYADDPAIPATADGREAFHRKPPVEILAEMFRLRARELYGRVRVLDMPESLDRFRRDVNATWLVNFCASTRCHGGENAGPLLLYNRDPRAERAALTNFIILDRARLADGRPLIDYEDPERSPLVQMLLPPQRSSAPHPQVKGWRPLFRTPDARRYTDAVEWIRSMRTPRDEAPIEYQPPTVADVIPADQAPAPAEPQPR